MKKSYARYVIIDAQDTCFVSVLELLPEWYENQQDALNSSNYSGECFYAKELEFTREYGRILFPCDKNRW